MNTEATYAKCLCRHCYEPIEFDSAHAGHVAPCPHCGKETDLYIPVPPRPPASDLIQSATNSRLVPCPDCDRPLSPSAHVCPGCGYITSKKPSRLGTLILAIIVLLGIFCIIR